MSEFRITTVDIPRELDPTGRDEFCQAMDLRNYIDAITFKTADTAVEPAEELPLWQPTEFESYRMLVATVDDRVVGRGDYETTNGDDGDTAWLTVHVHPEYQRRGRFCSP